MMRTNGARRGQRTALEQLVSEATKSGDFRVPWQRTPGIWAHYRDETEILRVLQRQWSTELGGAMFASIQSGDGDLAQDVALAYTDAVARMHGVYRILEANADHPAIAAERRKEHHLLASAGLRSWWLSRWQQPLAAEPFETRSQARAPQEPPDDSPSGDRRVETW